MWARSISNDFTSPFPSDLDLRWAQFAYPTGVFLLAAAGLAFYALSSAAPWARRSAFLAMVIGLLGVLFLGVLGLEQVSVGWAHGNDWGHLNVLDSLFSGILFPLGLIGAAGWILAALRSDRA